MAVETNAAKMKPIWFFVGLMLVIMGGVVLLTGLYILFVRPVGPLVVKFIRSPELRLGFGLNVGTGPPQATVLSSLHPDLWWGGFMLAVGAVFLILNRRARVG